MRYFPAFADTSVLAKPITATVIRRGRYVAGALAAVGSVALFQAGTGTAEAKTTSPPHRSSSPAPQTVTPKSVTYTLKVGDTLWDIAARNHISINTLGAANNIRNYNRIWAGELIQIPGVGGAAPAANAPKVTKNNIKAAADVFTGPAPKASPGGPFPAELATSATRKQLVPVFKQAAQQYGLPVNLLEAVAWNESGWSNKVVSSTGAIGIGQLMPDTCQFLNESLLGKPLDPAKPEHNIRMSARFLRYLLDENNGNTRMALASYYQGLASVRRIGPLPDTAVYVKTVIAIQRSYF